MPIPLETPILPVEPNTVKYDLSIASRIEGDKLKVAVAVNLRPCRCEVINGVEVYTDCGIDQPRSWAVADLEAYAIANPDLATGILQAWAALSAVVAAINDREKLL